MKSTFNQAYNQEEQDAQNGQLFKGILPFKRVFTLKSLEFFNTDNLFADQSTNDATLSPKEADSSEDISFENPRKDAKTIECEVCHKRFNTRSQKWYHRKKYEEGKGCNVKISLGRPKKQTKAASSTQQRRALKLQDKQEKVFDDIL